MTLQEFAEAMRLHPITVQRYIAAGMPAVKKFIGSGRQWRWEIDQKQAEKWIEKQRRGTADDE
jgi:hypothetical protein